MVPFKKILLRLFVMFQMSVSSCRSTIDILSPKLLRWLHLKITHLEINHTVKCRFLCQNFVFLFSCPINELTTPQIHLVITKAGAWLYIGKHCTVKYYSTCPLMHHCVTQLTFQQSLVSSWESPQSVGSRSSSPLSLLSPPGAHVTNPGCCKPNNQTESTIHTSACR